MKNEKKSVVILVADDDPEDCLLIKDAFKEGLLVNGLRFVEDGEELMDYLRRRGKYKDPSSSPRPGIILLDLNMPKKDGREALKEIKSDPDLRSIPVVILTTSKEEEDILRSYDLGANSYITKPVTFAGLVDAIKSLGKYWFEIVELPRKERRTEMKERKIRVLLIEDDEDDYTLVRDMLSEVPHVDYDVQWVSNYEQALKAIETPAHDVCLLDYRLGERNGIDLLYEAIGKSYCVPIIFVTGQGNLEVDMEAMKAGAADFLAKGEISGPLLDRSIRYSIEQRRDPGEPSGIGRPVPAPLLPAPGGPGNGEEKYRQGDP